MLSLLYVPTAPTGTRDRYILVFPSVIEVDAAARAVVDLDMPFPAVRPATLPADGPGLFDFGVAVLQATLRGDRSEVEGLRLAQMALSRFAESTHQPSRRRWIAGMLAGWVAVDRFEDHKAGLLLFRKAEELAQPGSLEAGEAIYAQCRAGLRAGRTEAVRDAIARLTASCGHLGGVEFLERAEQIQLGLGEERP